MVDTADLKSAGRKVVWVRIPPSAPENLMDAWYVYALVSEQDGGLYIGISRDVERRMSQHNAGLQQSTRSRRPFDLIFREECTSSEHARKREKYYKSGVGREFLRGVARQRGDRREK